MAHRTYKQLTARDRLLIAQLKHKGLKLAEIARRIGKSRSTLSREMKRNAIEITAEDRFFNLRISRLWNDEEFDRFLLTQPEELRVPAIVYSHSDAQLAADNRAFKAQQKRRRKLPATRQWVVEKLHLGWSPQQIAGRSRIDGPESVSHEYVYTLVYRSKKTGGGLHRLLKRFGRRKQRFGIRDYVATPAPTDRVSIDERPALIDERSRIGDCEADLIVGYKQSGYVLSVIDRKSRAVTLRKLTAKRMDDVRAELVVALKQFGRVYTLTVDNGKEFYGHKGLTDSLNVRVFFTHPYCSTERGSIENLNGLVRYYLPKRTSFEHVDQERLDEIASLLNHRPRECLGYLTPLEVHLKESHLCTLPSVALVG
jgi:IS30 family transposase